MSGQWRIAPSGSVMALDYGPLYARMERMRLDDDDWEELFANFTVIEAAAIKTINAKQKQ